jgi:hypothetical protein
MIKSFTTFVSSCVCGEANWTHTKKILRIFEGLECALPLSHLTHSLAILASEKKRAAERFRGIFLE